MKQTPRLRLIIHPGHTITKLVLLAVLILFTVSLIALYRHITAKEASNRLLMEQVSQLEERNRKLEQYVEQKHTEEGVLQVAQEEQGFVNPDTVIYDFG
jgi:cell division protein FtsB